MSETIIATKKLNKSYQEKAVLHDIDLVIKKGEIVSLIGPSGSGKSSLLRCLNGLEEITSGEILFHDRSLSLKEKDWQEIRKKVGMVFQSYDLFPNRTVLENLTIGPVMVKKTALKISESTALTWLKRVGLQEYAHHYPRELSGGQKQRVAIVRSLCMEPELILLDEITASLDPEMVREVLEVILNLAKTDTTMFIVTHEMAFARQVSDRIIFMSEGRIVEENTAVEFFTQPQTERARAFIQSLDFENLSEE
ncbi:amino acid ABC transporter ATP-binding protein [Enterococcus dongliensis]|uniref:Amino acid ABC transporter ATP-binding protein n=1 Tax=Enterococcus dongliensis TaxID=2559925 RepID=A0AAW8TQG4_9ENTE|nr:amino acid ABC transporter ATP-binding protein [Enterococcus dongliensis]MDT2604039.1 amino acid ABC transporter ATP-binding protein [Enterococcus dongliensis]MDT2635610.1 amino acid ABC transporter ATP-binding protein [Enterococcus dongliensis]MDT2638290.1 amino acid ABC transporter ATP-binding protein [Enterococcus dongliensis]MDT2643414.1 amino acid ABC transporter ATP-binding protein [Enterococcus dongliensis]MDT2645159.1 amino acid ABC transporter ATP-binding protein [Enterococcus dong